MLSIYDTASLEATLALPLSDDLRAHLERHINTARKNGLSDEATHILIVQPGDTEWDIEEEIGFSPVTDMEGKRFPALTPYWDHLQDIGGHFELIDTIGNTGFAFILLIDKTAWPELVAMCRAHA